MSPAKPKNVDAYLATVPKEIKAKLGELRTIIKKAAPKSEEKISYGMPYYHYNGRLAYFRLAKNHIGLYIPPPVIANHKKELVEYETTMATIKLPLDKKLPKTLIQKLVKSRAKINLEKKK